MDDTELDLIDAQKSILTAVVDRTNCEYPDIEQHLKAITPTTSLSRSALFFGGKGPADMESELNREILCADEICWVVSFIKTSGLNLLWNSLRKFTSEGKKLRIITTTYTGATDYDAMVRLASLPNTEIKISYDGTQDRLHAKSYIFLRNSGFHTAYIGSSNLSLYALRDGKEWNFKASQFELPQVIDEVRHSFEAYWCDATFEDFIPGVSNARLKKALGADWETPLLDFSALDLMRAKDYQQEILERLDVERNVHGHFRNLVVAATGTGKTVIAAFDFKRYREAHPDCRFLFVAHRQEILRQAMLTFRIVLEAPTSAACGTATTNPLCHGSFSLKGFLAYSHIPFHKIYGALTWGEMCQKAGVRSEVSAHAEQIKFAVNKKWLATDSFSYFTQLLQFVASGFHCDTRTFSEQQRRSAVMLYYDLYDKAGHYASIEEMFRDLASDPLFIQELHEVVDYLRDRCSAPEKADNSVYQAWNPLRLHGVYSKAQIQAALGLSTIERKSPSREGVERLKDIKLEAMYVDIIKKREEGSMTAYKDYAQNREFFHWETQNRVREGSREAEAYRNGENNMLLFVRQQVEHPDYGCRMGFTYLGQVTMKSIEGSKPMQIVWHLNTPMSEATYAFASQYKAIG